MTWYSFLPCLGIGLIAACASVRVTDAPRPRSEWAVLNIAHRGGIVPGTPENTLKAFRRAISLGVDAIELDLRGTRDGAIVIMHDATLEHTTDGTGKVTDHLLAELRQLDAGGGESIPTFAEVLDLVAGTGVKLLLDIKVSTKLDKGRVVRQIEERGAVLDVILGVRTLEDLREFRGLNPNIRTVGFMRWPDDIDAFVAAGIDIVRLKLAWIQESPDLVKDIQRRGKPVWVAAGGAPREVLEELIRSGVNGILTAYPEELAGMKKEMKANRNQR